MGHAPRTPGVAIAFCGLSPDAALACWLQHLVWSQNLHIVWLQLFQSQKHWSVNVGQSACLVSKPVQQEQQSDCAFPTSRMPFTVFHGRRILAGLRRLSWCTQWARYTNVMLGRRWSNNYKAALDPECVCCEASPVSHSRQKAKTCVAPLTTTGR